MKVWEFKCGDINNVAVLVFASHDELASRMFDSEGKTLQWKFRPHANVFVEPRKKRAKPRVDISLLSPGSFVMNTRAKATLGEFLCRFGQLLELDVDGEVEWFYSVTNIVDCIDLEKSTRRLEGTIAKEVFFRNGFPQSRPCSRTPAPLARASMSMKLRGLYGRNG